MMKNDQDIYKINMLYLLKIRELGLAGELQTAELVSVISAETVQRISRLSIDKIMSLSRTGIVSFQPRIPDRLWQDIEFNQYPDNILQARVALAISGEKYGHSTL